MLVDVVLLRRHGLRLRPSELDPPVRGQLEIRPSDARHSSFRRALLRADVYETIGVTQQRRSVVTPIFGVSIIDIDGDVLRLEGVELDADVQASRVSEHHQIWRCTLVTESGASGEATHSLDRGDTR